MPWIFNNVSMNPALRKNYLQLNLQLQLLHFHDTESSVTSCASKQSAESYMLVFCTGADTSLYQIHELMAA